MGAVAEEKRSGSRWQSWLLLIWLVGMVWLTGLPLFRGVAYADRALPESFESSQRPADDLSAAPKTAPRQADAKDLPSETVSQFVHAYLEVVELVERREIDLQRAETEAESLQIQREIQAEAFRLIEASGLTRRQYWQLLSLANVDADFRERVLAQVEEASL